MRVRELFVVVPARDEEALLPACLQALQAAVAASPVRVTTVVVLDRCTDGSAEVVAEHPWVVPVVSDAGQVGSARRIGVREAVRHAGIDDPDRCWLASTDADTLVPPDWLAIQVGFADAGNDAVLGTVVPDGGDLDPRVLRRWHQRHTLQEGHPYVHGANLGVRLSAYCAAGGFPPIAVHEDVELVAALRRTGASVVATATMQVRTSARTLGRTPPAFAGYLRELEDPQRPAR
ncbi:glycosyltransferase family 2 protein [Calidifontibacter terrae]